MLQLTLLHSQLPPSPCTTVLQSNHTLKRQLKLIKLKNIFVPFDWKRKKTFCLSLFLLVSRRRLLLSLLSLICWLCHPNLLSIKYRLRLKVLLVLDWLSVCQKVLSVKSSRLGINAIQLFAVNEIIPLSTFIRLYSVRNGKSILIHFNKNAVVFELFFSHLYGGVQAIIVDIEVDC